MSFPKYEKYKDSGVEWLGELPAHWEVMRLKNIASINMGQSPSSDDCTHEEIGLPFLQGNADFGELSPIPRSFCAVANKLAEVNDILFSVRAPVGAINIADQSYGIGRGLCAITPKHKHSMLFIFHALQVMKSELFAVATGSTYEAVSIDQVANASCLVPTLSEQTIIAEFLDRETAKIDELVAEQQRLIELLKEKRQAAISHAVTRGLNPNVKLKPSGIEWLGDVPEHWDVVRLKSLASEKLTYGANESAEDDNPDNPRFIRITDIADDGSLKKETFKSLSPEIAEPYLLRNGDILLARSGATVGKSIVYRTEWGKCCFAGYLIRLRCNLAKTSSDWINLFVQSSLYWGQIGEGTIQATIQNFSAEKYGEMRVPLPPLLEQTAIATFFDRELVKFDTLTAEAQHAIDLLQERRAALISAAVTGKIDVCQLNKN